MIKMFLFLLLVFGIVSASQGEQLFRIVKENAYVPSPINPEYLPTYILENYDTIINEDESISYTLKVIN